MVNQYAGAPDSKMKNRAIWSKTVVEDAHDGLYDCTILAQMFVRV
jgi:hypothetical protein